MASLESNLTISLLRLQETSSIKRTLPLGGHLSNLALVVITPYRLWQQCLPLHLIRGKNSTRFSWRSKHLCPTHLAIYNSLLVKVWWRYPGNWFKNFTSGHIFSLGMTVKMTMVAWRPALNYLYPRFIYPYSRNEGRHYASLARLPSLLPAVRRTRDSRRDHTLSPTRVSCYTAFHPNIHSLCVRATFACNLKSGTAWPLVDPQQISSFRKTGDCCSYRPHKSCCCPNKRPVCNCLFKLETFLLQRSLYGCKRYRCEVLIFWII